MSDLKKWEVEDSDFWESSGKKIANRNLWISIPSLLGGFAVWMMWGIITVQMLNLGFPFSQIELFTLMSIAGLAGATLRIPSTFFIRIAGGRNTIFFTTALLMIPAVGAGFALQDKATPLWVFQLLALLSGFGGGNFASSMSNISFFFPKRVQGTSLGLNAGLGNFGVTTMQVLVPLVMTAGVFGGGAMILENSSGTLIGKIPAGTDTFIHNAGFVWLILLIPLAFAGWFGMNNIVTETVTPNPGSPIQAFLKISGLLAIGFVTAAVGLYLLLPAPTGVGLLNKWIILPSVVLLTVLLMRYLTRG
jgi:NNP family nitrate/nitrite transporter-like MFS transporter